MTDPTEQTAADEHAALAFLSIPDDVERAFWGQRVFGKRYPAVLAALTAPLLNGEQP